MENWNQTDFDETMKLIPDITMELERYIADGNNED